jgi:hypothetical protein
MIIFSRLINKNKIINHLKEGDLRSIGKVPAVVEMVLADPALFPSVLKYMVHEDPGVRMRSSDAVEKISRQHPECLQPHKSFLLTEVIQQSQQEVRWHIAQIIPRLALDESEKRLIAEVLFTFLEDPSKIVQTNSLQALVDLTWDDDELFLRVKREVERLADTGSPAVKNRAEKLLSREVRKPGKPLSID